MSRKINCFDSNNKHILPYLALLLLTLLGAYLRIFGIINYSWGLDDFAHMHLSSGNSLIEVIVNSYRDAHPPLRNILLFAIRFFSKDPFSSRLVAIIPGILLIPAVYLLTFNLSKSQFASLITSSIIAFGYLFIRLSESTRPYMILCLVLTCYFYAFFGLIKSKSYKFFALYIISGFLVLATNYGAISIILAIIMTGLITLYRQNEKRACLFFGGSSILLLGWFLLQISFVFKLSSLRPQSALSYTTYMNLGIDEIVENILQMFNINFFYSMNYPYLMLMISLFCLLVCVLKKDWVIVSLAISSLIFGIIMAQASLYPFKAGQHSIALSVISIALIGCGIGHFCEHKNRATKLLQLSFVMIFSIMIFPRISFVDPNLIHKGQLFNDAGHSSEALENLALFLKNSTSAQDIILTSKSYLKMLDKHAPYTNNLRLMHRPFKKFYCKQRWHLISEDEFVACLNKLKRDLGDDSYRRKYVYIMSKFDPQSPELKKLLPIDIIDIFHEDKTRPSYTFTFNLQKK